MKDKAAFSVDENIGSFASDISETLVKVRETIRNAAPQALEVISYGMPAYKQKGNVIYFAAHNNHIGF